MLTGTCDRLLVTLESKSAGSLGGSSLPWCQNVAEHRHMLYSLPAPSN